ncbi:MAG: hypothetical protein IJT79_08470 [Ruminococcus sp.]|nr:hypothetical protein [Ruminococcus sp.]
MTDYATVDRAVEALKTARKELELVKDDTDNAVDHQLLIGSISKINKAVVELEIVTGARR